ncbi:MAG: bacteriocin [Phycisphaerales bacterium]|nr:bacteriocin [Phycisphaerales bacterium]
MISRTRLIACFLSLTIIAAGPATQPTPPAVGDKAPDFTLDTLDAKTVRLSELTKTGPVVLLELRGWVGYQCPLCTKQVHDFVTQAAALHSAGAHVVLVYPGSGDDLKLHAEEFVTGKGLPEDFIFVVDPGLKFTSDWGLRWNKVKENSYPATFVIDKAGIVRFAKISHSHGDRALAQEVIKALLDHSR